MLNKNNRRAKRQVRHTRVRKKVFGTPERPRLCVFRSLSNVYAQIVDDVTGNTLVSASSLEEEVKGKITHGGNKEAARVVGECVAKRALDKGINEVTFDRGGYIYHGRVKELAEGAREAGLQF